MADEVRPKRRSAGAGIGELQLLRGQRPGAPMPTASREPEGPRSTASEVPMPVLAAPVPSPTLSPVDAVLLRTELYLPEELLSDVRSELRPARTGHPRTLSVALLLQAYVRAIDALGLAIDLEGLVPGAKDEAVNRVTAALEVWKCS